MLDAIRYSVDDLRGAVRRRNIWVALASEDIGDAHRRSRLGPIWLIFSFLAFVGVITLVLHRSGGMLHYATYVAIGYLVYNFMSETLNKSVSVFVREESFISGTTLPLTIFVLRQTMGSAIRTGYAMLAAIAVMIVSGSAQPNMTWLTIVPAILLILATAPAVTIIMGMLGVFFPDFRYLMQPLMRIGIFATPIFWSPEHAHGVKSILYLYNPLTHYLEIVRYPIMTGHVMMLSWIVTLIFAVVLWPIALVVLGRVRREIVFAL